ncbi:MAG: hypothetical protein ACYC1T_11300 [Sulfuricaulis sp.]
MNNKPRTLAVLSFALAGLLAPGLASAMGLRSFVALPLEKGGTVLRLFAERNTDTDVDTLTTELAYGLSGTQTLFFGLPYRLSPAGSDRTGDLSALYRHIVWQVDTVDGTSRLGLLGGAVLPTESGRDGQLQAGAVATFFRRRYEWDLDLLYQKGLDQAPDSGRYDISWQYRLAPAVYPAWGIGSEWDGVLELNGRWTEGNETIHQVTAGLQWIHRRWVLEGGVVQDLNGPEDTRLVLSTRIHF